MTIPSIDPSGDPSGGPSGAAGPTGSSGDGGWNSIEDLADAVRTCTKCQLNKGRTNAVPGDGSTVASILIIGEGPGFHEDQQGLPFVGRSGKLLDELLAAVPLSRQDVFITNVVKCRPPDNRDPQPDEVAACRPYLDRQMELINPKVIVTLGRHSYLRFNPDGKISRDHGKILRWKDRILFPLYHPAAGLRNPAIKRNLQEDVLRLPEALRESLKVSIKASAENPMSEPVPTESAESAQLRPDRPEPASATQQEAQQQEAPLADTLADKRADTRADSLEIQNASTKISEPIIEEETTREKGDRQLGFF